MRGEKENRQPRRSSPLEAFPPVVTSAVSLPPSVRRLGRCQSLARALMRSDQSAARQRHAHPFFPFTRVSDAAKEGRVDGRVVDEAGGVAGRQARRTCRCESARPPRVPSIVITSTPLGLDQAPTMSAARRTLVCSLRASRSLSAAGPSRAAALVRPAAAAVSFGTLPPPPGAGLKPTELGPDASPASTPPPTGYTASGWRTAAYAKDPIAWAVLLALLGASALGAYALDYYAVRSRTPRPARDASSLLTGVMHTPFPPPAQLYKTWPTEVRKPLKLAQKALDKGDFVRAERYFDECVVARAPARCAPQARALWLIRNRLLARPYTGPSTLPGRAHHRFRSCIRPAWPQSSPTFRPTSSGRPSGRSPSSSSRSPTSTPRARAR